MQTAQERIFHLTGGRSLAAPFMFAPLEYDGNKEPADLAWVCGRTAFLIYCKASGQSFEKLDTDNLRQAASWIRFWRKGIRLRGASQWTSFNLGLADVDHIVVLSIVDCPGSRAFIHLPLSGGKLRGLDDQRVRLVATLPSSAFQALSETGAAPGDVLDLLEIIASHGALSERGVLDLLAERLTSIRRALRTAGANGDDVGLLDHLAHFCTSLRDHPGMHVGAAPVLADLELNDRLWLAGTALSGIRQIRAASGPNAPALMAWSRVAGAHRLHVSSVRGYQPLTDLLKSDRAEHFTSANMRFVFHVIEGAVFTTVAIDPDPGMPNLVRRLNGWKPQQSGLG